MRITQATMTNSFIRNLSKNLKQMETYHDKLTSGKEVSKPSDDPLLVGKIMDMHNNIKQNEQYNSNISDTLGWVATQDNALGGVTAGLNRIRELMIYGANGSLSKTDRLAIKEEVVMEIEGLTDVLNTNFDGRYIFAGQRTNTMPFNVKDGVIEYNTTQGSEDNIEREISQGVTIELITAGNIFTNAADASDDNKDLGKFLNDIVIALEDGGQESLEKISGNFLGDMDKHIENVLTVRSKIGAIDNRLEASLDRNKSENINLNTILTEREDIDIAEKYMEFITMSTIYQASLSIGSKIMQPSLLDYMR